MDADRKAESETGNQNGSRGTGAENGPVIFRGITDMNTRYGFEWPTLGLLGLCYGVWGAVVSHAELMGAPLTILALGLCLALFSSLQHEVLHGHPTSIVWLNTLLVSPPLGIVIPFQRFKELHLSHHHNQILTDPYDDPESYYVHPDQWGEYPACLKIVLTWNNTLAGRMIVGPALGIIGFVLSEFRLIRGGNVHVLMLWTAHLLLVGAFLACLSVAFNTSWWIYAAGIYVGTALIYIRTFLEHRAHENPHARTVVIEDRGLFAFLFLNNNFHAAHHARPTMPWYKLPGFYASNRDRFLACNEHYRYRSYADIFRTYAFRRKEPVIHPLVRQTTGPTGR